METNLPKVNIIKKPNFVCCNNGCQGVAFFQHPKEVFECATCGNFLSFPGSHYYIIVTDETKILYL